MEKSLWIKSKTKPGPKKKTNEFHPDRRENFAESDKGSWFNQPSRAKQIVLHLSMYQESVGKKWQ